MSSPDAPKPRPRSPHLQIYKPQLSSVLSITHRASGVGLTLGAVVFVVWLVALAGGQDSYNTFLSYAHTIIGQIILFGLSCALIYHYCCGIRHLLWDAGYCLDIKDVYKTGYIMLAIVPCLIAFVWLKAYGVIP
ncbi:MAG: succinate dehydrogenase, cytochrome b556 subunit [Alphaproteobacteria bacterium]|nr:succinate dehydrogenase, cytochrome b556 subunit [Alphaproteobacteria bacterium]